MSTVEHIGEKQQHPQLQTPTAKRNTAVQSPPAMSLPLPAATTAPAATAGSRIVDRAQCVVVVIVGLVVCAMMITFGSSMARTPPLRSSSSALATKEEHDAAVVEAPLVLVNNAPTTPPPPSQLPSPTPTPPSSCIAPPVHHLNIMCLGDSITYGNASHMPRKILREPGGNYPMTLKSLLDASLCDASRDTVDVFNLGMNGRTATDSINAYSRTHNWHVARSYAKKAHIVVVMLGTNDCRDVYWKGEDVFAEALAQYVTVLRGLNPSLVFVLMAPPPVIPSLNRAKPGVPIALGAFGIRPRRLREVVSPIIEAVAKNLTVGYLDVYAPINEQFPDFVRIGEKLVLGTATARDIKDAMAYAHDGAHPSMMVHTAIAQAVFGFMVGVAIPAVNP